MATEDPYLVPGKCYFVCNPAADSYVGRLVRVVDPFQVDLEDAAWIADTGRRHEFLRDGRAANMEVEPVGRVRARYQSIMEWHHECFFEAI